VQAGVTVGGRRLLAVSDGCYRACGEAGALLPSACGTVRFQQFGVQGSLGDECPGRDRGPGQCVHDGFHRLVFDLGRLEVLPGAISCITAVTDSLPPRSCLAITHATSDGTPAP
jgi:hypothetical protein